MSLPSLSDCILAVSTGWQAASLGVIRLSGPGAFEYLRAFEVDVPAVGARFPCHRDAWLVADIGSVPATCFWFRAPRSYTGQDLVEIHTVGSLPLLRAVGEQLIRAGARRAMPGEFTARAFITGKLDAAQVDGVLGLIRADDARRARLAARLVAGQTRHAFTAIRETLLDLLARLEAGIDFVDEEDVRFITPDELSTRLDALQHECKTAETVRVIGREVPHVTLVGLPNAGKSTLFNALVGQERAIVSPLIGTTRDLLRAEVRVDGRVIVLQDCAGLGATSSDLELAAHRASESAAEQADLVLWVHETGRPLSSIEVQILERIPRERRILVLSKQDDLTPVEDRNSFDTEFAAMVAISAQANWGLERLRSTISRCLAEHGASDVGSHILDEALLQLSHAVRACREILQEDPGMERSVDLLAMELRSAIGLLSDAGPLPVTEEILGRIYASFCVGK